jgi:diacylglycerol kinase family enzyme
MITPRRIVFLINPISGTRTKDGLEEFLTRTCHEKGIEYMIVYSVRNMTADMLQMQLYDFKATDLVACGGDGTVNLGAAAVIGSGINLGVIAVGSGNGLARTACIPMKPSQALEIILNCHLQPTDSFTVNDRFGCMLSGIGMDAAVAERFAQSDQRGLFTYTTQTLIQYFKSNPYQFEIEVEGIRFFTDAFFISIANSNQFGNNVTIAPLASLNDGLLDIIIVQKMPKMMLPCALMRQLRNLNKKKKWMEEIGKKTILYFQTPEIIIHNPKHAPLHIDGDPASTDERLHIKVVPDAFNLWVPGKGNAN